MMHKQHPCRSPGKLAANAAALSGSQLPMHTDVAGESIVDTAEATAMEEEELIAEAPSSSSC